MIIYKLVEHKYLYNNLSRIVVLWVIFDVMLVDVRDITFLDTFRNKCWFHEGTVC